MPDKKPPVGKVARATVVGITAAKVGAKKAGLLSKRPFLSRESFERHRQQNDEDIAHLIFQGLSTLRGTALKLAQLLSLELVVLPKVYREELYKAHYRVPPLNRAVVRSVVLSELGKSPEAVFSAFDDSAFAAASLGQVHRATLPTGECVAVKIQYPGIASTLKNDLHLVQQFMRPFYSTEYISAVLQEVEQCLIEEVDYNGERQRTEWFSEHVKMPGITIPKTFAEYSSTRVLTTELLDGMHLDAWLATNPTQEERNRAAQLMYDFFSYSLFELHCVHVDPNPGNYLFRDDGTIAVIDFGSVKTFDPKFCTQMAELYRAHLRSDFNAIVDSYCELGIANGDREKVEEFCRTDLIRFGQWLVRPHREETFDFAKHSDYGDEATQFARDFYPMQALNGFTPETTMFDRNRLGLFRIFTQLKACVRLRNQWLY